MFIDHVDLYCVLLSNMNNILNILSLNVRGINDKTKRQKVFYWLKKQNCDIYLLQETHLGTDKNKIKWYNEWGGKSFWTFNSTNSKGVSVLINPKCDYNVLNVNNSGDGRIISVEIEGTNRLNIVNLYAPNNEIERKTFFDKAVSKFLSHDIENIVAGDFNCTLYDEDRHEQRPNTRKTTETGKAEILNLMADYEMCDIYSKWKPKKS